MLFQYGLTLHPKQVHDTVQSFMDGDIAKATKMQLEAIDLIGALFSEVNPIPVKACNEHFRL